MYYTKTSSNCSVFFAFLQQSGRPILVRDGRSAVAGRMDVFLANANGGAFRWCVVEAVVALDLHGVAERICVCVESDFFYCDDSCYRNFCRLCFCCRGFYRLCRFCFSRFFDFDSCSRSFYLVTNFFQCF